MAVEWARWLFRGTCGLMRVCWVNGCWRGVHSAFEGATGAAMISQISRVNSLGSVSWNFLFGGPIMGNGSLRESTGSLGDHGVGYHCSLRSKGQLCIEGWNIDIKWIDFLFSQPRGCYNVEILMGQTLSRSTLGMLLCWSKGAAMLVFMWVNNWFAVGFIMAAILTLLLVK
ncbi:hypothetical protein R6Q59_035251 [Mikania micrantha]